MLYTSSFYLLIGDSVVVDGALLLGGFNNPKRSVTEIGKKYHKYMQKQLMFVF